MNLSPENVPGESFKGIIPCNYRMKSPGSHKVSESKVPDR
jgi:hypothetical protein